VFTPSCKNHRGGVKKMIYYLYGVNPSSYKKILIAYGKDKKELERLQGIAKKLSYTNFEIRG